MVPVMYVTEKFDVFYFSGNRDMWPKEIAHYFPFSVRGKVLNFKAELPLNKGHMVEILVSVALKTLSGTGDTAVFS